jgi:hypothetical protein
MAKTQIVTVNQYSKASGMVKQRITAMLRNGEMPPGIVSGIKSGEGAKCAWIMQAQPGWEQKIKILTPYERLS